MARELIKVKLHNNSPEDKTIFQELADMLGAELVQVIGFNGVLYKAKKNLKSFCQSIISYLVNFIIVETA